MMRSVPQYLICAALVLFCVTVAQAQNPGDNEFHFVASFDNLPESNNNGDMTNIKYIGDTDQDELGEFAFLTTNTDSCYFVVYEATGDDTYEQVYLYPFKPTANGNYRDWTAIVAGDLNANGVVEIIVGLPVDMTGTITDPNPARVVVFEWAGTVGENVYGFDNGASPSALWNFDVPDNYSLVPFQFAIDDIDNDGVPELIADFREPKAIYVISQPDSWDFPGWTIEWYITNFAGDPNYVDHFDGGGYYGSGIGDLDSDGKKEIYAPVWDLLTLNIYECQGPGDFTREAYLKEVRPDADYGAVRGALVGDVNRDGVKELYIIGTDKDDDDMGHVFAISNITDVSQVDSASIKDICIYPTHPNNATGRAARSGFLNDIDMDGNDDILICGSGNGQVYDIEYNWAGDPLDPDSWTFTVAFDLWMHWATYLPNETIQQMSPRFWDGDVCEDMDGDGHKEFVVINYGTDRGIVPDDPWFYIFEEGATTAIASGDVLNRPQDFSLLQNYPNPFNPSTSIRFNLATESRVELKVFNTLGMEVKTLISGVESAGEKCVHWNGTDDMGRSVVSGVYIYRLKIGDRVFARAMTLAK